MNEKVKALIIKYLEQALLNMDAASLGLVVAGQTIASAGLTVGHTVDAVRKSPFYKNLLGDAPADENQEKSQARIKAHAEFYAGLRIALGDNVLIAANDSFGDGAAEVTHDAVRVVSLAQNSLTINGSNDNDENPFAEVDLIIRAATTRSFPDGGLKTVMVDVEADPEYAGILFRFGIDRYLDLAHIATQDPLLLNSPEPPLQNLAGFLSDIVARHPELLRREQYDLLNDNGMVVEAGIALRYVGILQAAMDHHVLLNALAPHVVREIEYANTPPPGPPFVPHVGREGNGMTVVKPDEWDAYHGSYEKAVAGKNPPLPEVIESAPTAPTPREIIGPIAAALTR